MTVLELFDLIARFGLPLVMFLGVLWLSATGKITWPPTIRVYEEQLRDALAQRDRFANIALPAVAAVEKSAEALRAAHSGGNE